MEESKDTSKDLKIKIIYYLNKNPKQEDNMKLYLLENNHNIIFYEQITYSFCNFLNDLNYNTYNEEDENSEIFQHLEEKDINFDYIRYFNGKSWILLDKGGVIAMNENFNFNTLKIMIKANIFNKEKNYIKNNYFILNKKIENIGVNLDKIESDIKTKSPLNIIVLTANPLMHGEKELRTMNDFNIIPGKIYNILKEEDYLKYSKFEILTQNTFKEAISKRPQILHLICKSTYISPEEKENNKISDDSSDYVNLIFENENNYSLEFINKEKLNEILSDTEIKENIKNIILIISTQLSDDIKKIFEKFEFKGIIVQHTTLADISLIANFNNIFYEDIILSGLNIIQEENIAVLLKHLSDKVQYTICCCFHKHKVGQCKFVKNILNELYNNNNYKKEKDIKDELKEIIPHFCHLMPKCPFTRVCNSDDFCQHIDKCSGTFNLDYKKRGKKINNTCCCYDQKNQHDYKEHNINASIIYVFPKESENDNNNNKKPSIYEDNEKNIPKYEKMELLIGRNKDMIMILEFLKSEKQNYNIYGDKITNLKKFGNIIIEYYKEREHYNNLNKKYFIRICFESNEDEKKIEEKMEDPDIDKFDYKLNDKVYFFYIEDMKLYGEIKKKIKDNIKNNKIIWFSEESIDNKFNDSLKINKEPEFDERIKIKEEPELQPENEYKGIIKFPPNNYIKFQNNPDLRKIWMK